MRADDHGVFEYLRKNSESPEIAGLAYSSYVFEKYEWADRQAQLRNQPATAAEIDAWIAGLPDSWLDGLIVEATDLFDRAARAYMESEKELTAKEATEFAITAEVRRRNKKVLRKVVHAASYWHNFVCNVFVGLISSIIFVLVVVGGAWVFASDPSPFATLKQFIHGKFGQQP